MVKLIEPQFVSHVKVVEILFGKEANYPDHPFILKKGEVKDQPSGCEDCDFTFIDKRAGVGTLGLFCSKYDQECDVDYLKAKKDPDYLDCLCIKSLLVLPIEDLTDDLTHIEPPAWCPGG